MDALVEKPGIGAMPHFQKPFMPSGAQVMSQAAAQMISAQVMTSAKMYPEARHAASSAQMMSASPLVSPTAQLPPRPNNGVRPKERKVCQVCGELGSGNFFGALVCLPCKTFFIRCSSEEVSTFRCRRDGDCEITGPNRSRCKYCRYQQCVLVGMIRKERPEQIEACEGQQLCVVCGDVANGIHFGVMSCEGCKKFFRRGLQESDGYICKSNQRCIVNPRTRNECRYCRFQKCLHVGMSRLGERKISIKMGRPRKNMRDYQAGYLTENGNSMSSQSPPIGHSPPASGLQDGSQVSYTGPLSPGSMSMQNIGYHPYKSPYQTVFGGLNHVPIDIVSPERKPHQPTTSTNLPPNEETAYCSESSKNVLNLSKKRNEDNIVDLARVKEEPYDDGRYGQRSLSPHEWGGPSPRKYPEDVYSTRASAGHHTPSHTYPATIERSGSMGDMSTDTGYSSPKEQREEGLAPDTHRISPIATSRPASVQSLTDDEVYISYVFPERYWLRPYIPHEKVAFGETNRKLVHDIIDLYLDFMTSFCQEDELSRMLKDRQDDVENLKTKDVWDLIRSRITKSTLDVLKFIKSLPGFSDVHPDDQYLICRLGVFQCSTLMAAINLYDPQTNNFIRNFYEHPIPLEELNELRASLRDYARALHALRLDTVESALLCCLIIMASDWPNLKSPGALEDVRWQLLSAFRAYVEVKYRRATNRLEDLFGHVPRLRQLGMWHYRLSFEMFLDQKTT